MFLSIIFAEKFNYMEYSIEVKARNSKVRSSLHGVFSPFRDGIMFTFHVHFDGVSSSKGNLIFSSIDELTDYLIDGCGYDSFSLKKL